MFQDLFLNATIIVSFISVGNQFIFREHKISTDASKSYKIAFGVLNGALGCLLMLYSVTVMPNIILDLRSFSIIIASLFGGFASAFIASLIIGVFRITYFGIQLSSIIAFFFSIVMGIGCSIIVRKVRQFNKRWLYASLFCTTTGSLAYLILVKDHALLAKLLLVYWSVSITVTIILAKYTGYISSVNNLFRKYREQSSVDFLTGLYNVRQFDRVFNTVSCRAVERGESLSILFIDIDFFKKVNDTYGHIEGDIVLKELGDTLVQTCRSFDVVSRNGGEEFSVLLIDCPSDRAIDMAERIRSAIESHEFVLSDGVSISITISIGVATYPDTINDINKLIEQADKALYQAKQTGRNKVVFRDQDNDALASMNSPFSL